MDEKVILQNKELSIRPVKITYDSFGYADASVLLELGKTKVLCCVALQDGVPSFLRGQGSGWLTAEYSMLPCATLTRTLRESTLSQKNARSVEISRLIGRSLRSIVNLDVLGEKTIHIDCDVLQADGGTRVACITAANFALKLAEKRWRSEGVIRKPLTTESVVAISVGVVNEIICLDLNCEQDNGAQADFNFVVTQSGGLVEVQGTAEKNPLLWSQFEELRLAALIGSKQLFDQCDAFSSSVQDRTSSYTLKKQPGIISSSSPSLKQAL